MNRHSSLVLVHCQQSACTLIGCVALIQPFGEMSQSSESDQTQSDRIVCVKLWSVVTVYMKSDLTDVLRELDSNVRYCCSRRCHTAHSPALQPHTLNVRAHPTCELRAHSRCTRTTTYTLSNSPFTNTGTAETAATTLNQWCMNSTTNVDNVRQLFNNRCAVFFIAYEQQRALVAE